MFCKPPCPDEHDLSPVADPLDDRSSPEHAKTIGGHTIFGRPIAPEAAGPERKLPPASVRTG